MGTWGHGLLENDTSSDVQAAFERHLEKGLSTAGAVGAIYEEFQYALKDSDSRPDVVLALAWITGARGKVPARVLKDALNILQTGGSLARWEGSPEYGARQQVEQTLLGILEGTSPHPERQKKVTKTIKAKIGDVLEMPLSTGARAYGRYVHHHPKYGAMLEIYRQTAETTPPLDQVIASGPKFPPLFVHVATALNHWGWPIVGNVPVTEFSFPVFADRAAKGWWMYDGIESKWVESLPDTVQVPEPLVIWGHNHLLRRIETGEHGFNK